MCNLQSCGKPHCLLRLKTRSALHESSGTFLLIGSYERNTYQSLFSPLNNPFEKPQTATIKTGLLPTDSVVVKAEFIHSGVFMKSLIRSLVFSLALTASLAVTSTATARQNPAVQPIFFEHLQAELPTSEPAPIGQQGDVTEVTLAGLAWAVDNVKNDPVPLVIEFYSSDASACATSLSNGTNECTIQPAATQLAAANYPNRVRFLRIDVKNYPVLLNGPDVRVLPSHIIVAGYTDTNTYTAIKVGGYLSDTQIQSLVKETLGINP
jgi:hypothetical protein